jgi:hypothetical protein
MGQPRRFSNVPYESGLSATLDVSQRCNEPTLWANNGLMHRSKTISDRATVDPFASV